MILLKTWLSLCLWVLLNFAQGQHLYEKANDFLATLSPALQEKALFAFDDAERFNMNYVPLARQGVTFHDFNDQQQEAALALLRACLSQRGYQKTRDIMELENVLLAIEDPPRQMPDGSPMRDPLNYYFSIFGRPSPEGYWGWRLEGHHVSLNFTAADGKIASATPAFWGSNPGVVTAREQRRQEILKREADLGFALVNALTADQLRVAKFADQAPNDIITTTQRKVESIDPKGISYRDLTQQQRDTLMALLDVYIDNYELGFAQQLRDKIHQSGIENLHFAWAGSLAPGRGHYYRIQGPMLIIEYDNTQNNANHVHTVVRDLTNDFAEDILREHYRREH